MTLHFRLLVAVSGLWLGLANSVPAADEPEALPVETAAQRAERMHWFNEARFGMFIHWGVYSVPAGEYQGNTGYGEWIMEEARIPVSTYEKFADQFNPVKFNATDWVRMAKEAGMKYIVITSKHHDGFGLWDSQMTDWDIGRTPFKRDPLKELADACAKSGIKFCFYHSIMDWHHPDWGTRRAWNDLATGTPDMDRYTAYMKGQLKELLTGYGPLGILWFDGEWESPWTNERGRDLYAYCRRLQPDIIINNRVGKGRAGMSGMDAGEGVGDYGTPEQEIPPNGFGPGVSWESCMTMNHHWGYNKNDHNWKSASTLVRNLIDCSSKGGNYLLNVGPTAEGLFPAASVERLAQIGEWMKINGQSIYGTTASSLGKLPWGRCTQKTDGADTMLYLHVFDWPSDGRLIVPRLLSEIKSASLLVDGKSLEAKRVGENVEIAVPAAAPDAISSTILLRIVGRPEVAEFRVKPSPDGSFLLNAAEVSTVGGSLRTESKDDTVNLGYWVDATDRAEWPIVGAAAGRYDVSAELASDAASEFAVEAGAARMETRFGGTGSYSRFTVVQLGSLDLNLNSGKHTVVVRPIAGKWSPINLRWLKLTPVAAGSK